ncbi:MAG: O-antigen ligase family protein [Flavobacteriaceae bacterium]
MNKIINIIFYLGLFFFAFNSFEGPTFLGEFKDEAGVYFFVSGFLLLFFNQKIFFPIKSHEFQIVLIFLGWCFLCTLLNIAEVSQNYFKHTYGINRFIRQYFSICLSSVLFFLFFYSMLKKMSLSEIFINVRRVFLFSLIFAFILGFFETLYSIFGIGQIKKVIDVFNLFPFVEKDVFNDRISSIGNEPPLLAIYLITISGWMFSYIITNKGWLKYLPTILVLFLTYFCGSRTGLIVILFQMILFFATITPTQKIIDISKKVVLYITILVGLVIVFNGDKIVKSVEKKLESLDFKGNLEKSISNQSRFGMQYATLEVFKEHPIVGVGFGQQSYYSRHKYPRWAKKNNYEFKLLYENNAVKAFPPGYNIYTRIMAETGLIGLLIILYMIYYTLRKVRKIIKNSDGLKTNLSLILLTSFAGLYINWLQIDSFKIFGIWFSLALLIRLQSKELDATT